MNPIFEICIIASGFFAGIRGFQVHNLIRDEKGLERQTFWDFLSNDKTWMTKFIIIRPFLRKQITSKNKRRVNILTYIIYFLLLTAILSVVFDK
jgi:hypothetical protein